jgi:hypothetical protein
VAEEAKRRAGRKTEYKTQNKQSGVCENLFTNVGNVYINEQMKK